MNNYLGISGRSVTVLIINFNSDGLLTDCLEHLKAQTIQPDHILIIDNASTDDSLRNIPGIENVSVNIMDCNLGFAAGNDHGLDASTTEFVALLNPDAFPDPHWLESLLAAADKYPECASFGSRQLNYQYPELLDGIGDKYHISGLVWRERHGETQRKEDLTASEIFSPCAAAALYRRQDLIDAGGFDEDYFCYVEDVDLGFRLRLAGHKARYVPDAVVHHIGSATTGVQQSDFSVYHGHRNLVWTYVKNMPGVLFWLLLPYHILLNIVTIGWFVLRGKGGVILRAKWDAIKALPAMWRKRRVIQSNRVASLTDIWHAMDKRIIPWN